MTRAVRRWGVAVAAVLLWLAAAFATAAYFYLRNSAEPPQGTIELSGLRAPVRVWADSFAIPHAFAESEHDLWFAQGYLHATHRLWQMELFRRAAAGRLAELFGAAALPSDRLARTLDLAGIAARRLDALTPIERAPLEAYAAGVNARLETVGLLPPEFLVLGAEPEPWSASTSLAVAAVMSLDLAVWRRDLSRFHARAHLSAEKYALLELPYPAWGPATLPDPVSVPAPPEDGGGMGAGPVLAGGTHGPAAGAHDAAAGAHGADPFAVLKRFSVRSASNAWAVGAGRTRNGAALLANDMHLALRAPAIWYVAALHAESARLHVAGLTLPGLPGVIVGYNRGVAWGFSNAMVDDMDFAVETLNAAGTAYRAGGEWVRFSVRPETIRVRGSGEPEVLRVRSTVRGPLISDVLPGLETPLSALWVAAAPGSASLGLAAMNRAATAETFDRALRSLSSPNVNVVYAARDGGIGYRLAGTLPLRGAWSGTLPAVYSIVGRGWHGFWPPGSHPAGTEPPSDYFVSANNLQAPELYGVLSRDYPLPFRARRISDRLEAEASWDRASTARLQRDTHSLLAGMLVDRAVRAAERAGAAEAATTLRAWDHDVSLRSRAAPLFLSWLYRLRVLVAADEYADAPQWSYFPISALLASLELGDGGPWVDDVRTPGTERLADLSARAMEDALAVTGGRTWGELHFERHRHPLGRLAWLERLFALDVGPYAAPGGPYTVRPDDYSRWLPLDSTSWTPPYVSDYGPTERFIAELGPGGARGWLLLPTGQSGNPLSPHYRDMAVRWRDGDLIPVPLEADAARARAVREFRLVPVAGR